MSILGLLLLQLALQFVVLLYWKRRWESKTNLEQFRVEVEQLIIAFNQYADRNISLLEDRKSQADASLKKVEKAVQEAKKLLFFEKGAKGKGTASVPKPRKANVVKSKAVQVASKGGRKSGLEAYLLGQEAKQLKTMSVEERLLHYKGKNMPNGAIARLLGLSTEEVNLRVALEGDANKRR